MNDGQAPVEGQLVSAPAIKAGGHIFMPAVFGSGDARKLHKLSQREAKFLKVLLETQSYERAGAEIGVDYEAAKRWGKRKAVQAYIHDMLEQKALAEGLTLQKLLAKLNQAVDGDLVLKEGQTEAIKIAARLLRPAVAVQVNNLTQNNINAGAGPSPYSGLSAAESAELLKQRLGDLNALR